MQFAFAGNLQEEAHDNRAGRHENLLLTPDEFLRAHKELLDDFLVGKVSNLTSKNRPKTQVLGNCATQGVERKLLVLRFLTS